jgi:predicted oxidoreductase
MMAYNTQTPLQLEAYAEAVPNTLAINKVTLKAMRRPIISDPMPQKKLPKHSPRNTYEVV